MSAENNIETSDKKASDSIDWQNLHKKAQQVSECAYAPYSNFKVGAALLSEQGQVFTGCNVENASYGLTVCAERNCIATAVAQGTTQVSALVVYTAQQQLTSPCGACRQVIAEFMAPEAIVSLVNHLGDSQQWRVADLLPAAFTPQNLKNSADNSSVT
ncbi:MAG: cytidine deaminase [Alteromonadaceae bacterium]|nr:cytidine deaminase [Alteromonadaceae bacterium]